MPKNLLKDHWKDIDPGELIYILYERLGRPGQYQGRKNKPAKFCLPLAGLSCQIKLTYFEDYRIQKIEPGPAFDASTWGTGRRGHRRTDIAQGRATGASVVFVYADLGGGPARVFRSCRRLQVRHFHHLKSPNTPFFLSFLSR